MKKIQVSEYQQNFRAFTLTAAVWFAFSLTLLYFMKRIEFLKIFYIFFGLSILNLVSLGRLVRVLLFPETENRLGILIWMPLKLVSIGGAIWVIFLLGRKDVLPEMLLGLSGWVVIPLGGVILTQSRNRK